MFRIRILQILLEFHQQLWGSLLIQHNIGMPLTLKGKYLTHQKFIAKALVFYLAAKERKEKERKEKLPCFSFLKIVISTTEHVHMKNLINSNIFYSTDWIN